MWVTTLWAVLPTRELVSEHAHDDLVHEPALDPAGLAQSTVLDEPDCLVGPDRGLVVGEHLQLDAVQAAVLERVAQQRAARVPAAPAARVPSATIALR